MAPFLPEGLDSVKYNHFHEYDEDNDELFEIREITPTPDPSTEFELNNNRQPLNRVGKFRNVLRFVVGRKSGKQIEKQLEETSNYLSGGRHATFPRMNKSERDARVRDLRDEVFGEGKFYQEPDPSKLYEKEDPKPFVSTYAARVKAVRWKLAISSDGNEEISEDGDSKSQLPKSRHGQRGDDPYWEEEFELPEPDMVPSRSHPPLSGCIPLDLSKIVDANPIKSSKTKSSGSLNSVNSKDSDAEARACGFLFDDAKLGCSCGEPSCNEACAHVLTPIGIRSNLGREIMNLITRELILRLGPPLPLPPRKPQESESTIISLRDKEVIQTYATWAATFTFQKLIVAIRLSIDRFTPSHRGLLSFEFEVQPCFPITNHKAYPIFRRLDIKTRYLVIREMRVIFDEHVQVLQNKYPKDAGFRQKIIGVPFWAEGQEYRFTPIGVYSGVLLHYKIKRGGVRGIQRHEITPAQRSTF